MRRVIKVGTSTALTADGEIYTQRLATIASGIKHLITQGDSVIVVTSGAVGAGRRAAPASRAAAAAIGQVLLADAYRAAFHPLGAAQLLVDQNDLTQSNAVLALQTVIHHIWNSHAVPIVNENDALRGLGRSIGDNDTLAALLSGLIGADQLVILSDIDGLYTDNPFTNPNAQRIAALPRVSTEHFGQFGEGHAGPWGSGGIVSKLKAAHIAQRFGIETILAAGHDDQLWTALLQRDYERVTRFGGEEVSRC